jgi:hypothetical protein
MKKLNSFAVSEPWQIEIMRDIYNENLDMLATIPIPYRSFEEQQTWWENNKQKVKAFLYEPVAQPGKFIAFSLLTDRGDFCTPIMAIKKNEWGKGYGTEIINDYIKKANGPLAGSQLQSNAAICHMNKKVGWQIIDQVKQSNGFVDLLYHPGINPAKDNQKLIYDKIIKYLKEKHIKQNIK